MSDIQFLQDINTGYKFVEALFDGGPGDPRELFLLVDDCKALVKSPNSGEDYYIYVVVVGEETCSANAFSNSGLVRAGDSPFMSDELVIIESYLDDPSSQDFKLECITEYIERCGFNEDLFPLVKNIADDIRKSKIYQNLANEEPGYQKIV